MVGACHVGGAERHAYQPIAGRSAQRMCDSDTLQQVARSKVNISQDRSIVKDPAKSAPNQVFSWRSASSAVGQLCGTPEGQAGQLHPFRLRSSVAHSNSRALVEFLVLAMASARPGAVCNWSRSTQRRVALYGAPLGMGS